MGSRSYRNDRLHRPHILPRALASGCGWARNAKNLSRVREVCARVEDDGVHPYLVVRGGHCGPARLLPIIMANESTEGVWHNPRASLTVVSGCGLGYLRWRTKTCEVSYASPGTRSGEELLKATVRPSRSITGADTLRSLAPPSASGPARAVVPVRRSRTYARVVWFVSPGSAETKARDGAVHRSAGHPGRAGLQIADEGVGGAVGVTGDEVAGAGDEGHMAAVGAQTRPAGRGVAVAAVRGDARLLGPRRGRGGRGQRGGGAERGGQGHAERDGRGPPGAGHVLFPLCSPWTLLPRPRAEGSPGADITTGQRVKPSY